VATAGAFFRPQHLEDERARIRLSWVRPDHCSSRQRLKALSGRQRPSFADGVDGWWGPAGLVKRYGAGQAGKYVSFPSGHTTNAFALATVIALQYRQRAWVPVLAYAVASAVGLRG
jgi:membrane-associated phospholipid phosphatase